MLAFPYETVLYFTKTSVSSMVIFYIMELFDWIKWKKENCISQWNIRNAHLNHRLKKRFIIYFMGHINCQQTSQRCSCSCSGLPSSIILIFRVFSRQKEHSVLYSNKFYRTNVAKLIFTEIILLKSMTDVSKAVSCAVQNQSRGWQHKVTKYLNAISGKASVRRTLFLNAQVCLAPPEAV